MRASFSEQLSTAWSTSDSLLCVGLDPDPSRLPEGIDANPAGYLSFSKAIVDATATEVCAYKPQAAHFGSIGAEDALAQLIDYIHTHYPHIPVVLDAKRGDVGSTATRYAVEAFERYDADAVTVNPYLGRESVEPYLAYPERGVILLCRTSNPDSDWLQGLPVPDGGKLFHRVARTAVTWNAHGNIGLVTGATYPEELAEVRELVGSMPLLVPGVGAQGGAVDKVLAAGATEDGTGLMVSASRSVIFASSGPDFAEAAGEEARRLRQEINTARRGLNL